MLRDGRWTNQLIQRAPWFLNRPLHALKPRDCGAHQWYREEDFPLPTGGKGTWWRCYFCKTKRVTPEGLKPWGVPPGFGPED